MRESMVRSQRRSPGWLRGFAAYNWGEDSAYAALLDALTRDRLETDLVEREMESHSRRSLAEVREEQDRAERNELSEARAVLEDFRAALEDVRRRGGSGGDGEVAYDSQDPDQNAQADILIQYLVRPGYAEVRTDEPAPEHYVYYLRVDWDRLRALAAEQGQPISF
jgi:hypothetical protein